MTSRKSEPGMPFDVLLRLPGTLCAETRYAELKPKLSV